MFSTAGHGFLEQGPKFRLTLNHSKILNLVLRIFTHAYGLMALMAGTLWPLNMLYLVDLSGVLILRSVREGHETRRLANESALLSSSSQSEEGLSSFWPMVKHVSLF